MAEIRNYRHTVGRNIRTLREAQGLSLRRFALMVDMDYTYLCEIEKGKANATVDILAKIAAGLEVDPADFFTRSDEMLD